MESNTEITREWLYKRYPWLKIRTTLEDYVAPDYYNKLLKPYVFEGEEDLKFLVDFIEKLPGDQKVLELGTGTGRVTTLALNSTKTRSFTGVDLSEKMIKSVSKRFSEFKNASFVQSDSLKFLESSDQKYDFVFSLWSLSHSIHQHMETLGVENGFAYAHRVLFNFLMNQLISKGSFFLIHFDALSEEQIILRRILQRVSPLYHQPEQQSYSKRAVDYTLQSLEKAGVIKFNSTHHVGDPIVYKSMDEALEVFINFHLESHFNDSDDLVAVYKELYEYLAQFENEKKEVIVRPGCFIYEVKKI